MKCIPITWVGRRVFAAISVMEIELVLDARIADGGAMSSRRLNRSNFSPAFSDAA
jgi:hypothetical protein